MIVYSFKACKEGRQFLSNVHTLSDEPNCSCQNIVCLHDTGVGTYSLSCYTLQKHLWSEWQIAFYHFHFQPWVAPTLVNDISYLLGELTKLPYLQCTWLPVRSGSDIVCKLYFVFLLLESLTGRFRYRATIHSLKIYSSYFVACSGSCIQTG